MYITPAKIWLNLYLDSRLDHSFRQFFIVSNIGPELWSSTRNFQCVSSVSILKFKHYSSERFSLDHSTLFYSYQEQFLCIPLPENKRKIEVCIIMNSYVYDNCFIIEITNHLFKREMLEVSVRWIEKDELSFWTTDQVSFSKQSDQLCTYT